MSAPASDVEVPTEFAQALRELGLAAADTVTGTPLTGGVSSDIWRIDSARGAVCAKRALPKLRVAADWRAPIERNRYEARWMRRGQRDRTRAARRACWASIAALGVLVMELSAAVRIPRCGSSCCVTDSADAATPARLADLLGSASTAIPLGDRNWPPQFDTDADLLRHPARAVSAGHRARHPESRTRLEQLVEVTRSHQVALVHGDVSPKNILIGAAGPGVPRRRVRVVGRSGVRPCVLPEPPAAQVPVDAARRAELPRAFDALARGLSQRRVDWEPRRRSSGARRRCCRACCSRGSMASPRSSTSPDEAQRERCGAWRARCCSIPCEPGRGARRVEPRSSSDERHARSRIVRARRVWDSARPADGRGRGDARRAARWAARSLRRARRRARARRSTCATAAHVSAGSTCSARSAMSTARSHER